MFSEFKNRIKAIKSDRARATQVADGHLEEIPDGEPRPSQVLSDIDSQRDVLEKMTKLTEEEQDLISMRIFEKKDWHEIGAILGCSRVLASQHFDHAIANLARTIT